MENYMFFDFLPVVLKLKLITKFFTLLKKNNRKIPKKQYKYYLSLLKQYRYLGIYSFKSIKFVKIK